jgi:hypothetical protein
MSNNNHPIILYKVTISEVAYEDFEQLTPIYEQVVEELDIKALIAVVNNPPAIPTKKTRAPRSDKGKKRSGETVLDSGEIVPTKQ